MMEPYRLAMRYLNDQLKACSSAFYHSLLLTLSSIFLRSSPQSLTEALSWISSFLAYSAGKSGVDGVVHLHGFHVGYHFFHWRPFNLSIVVSFYVCKL
jgi:hypothetical protein